MKSGSWVAVILAAVLTLTAMLLAALGRASVPATAAGILITATPTFCPVTTPEPFWVDPVTSPTDQFTQVVTVHLGNGEAVTVTAQSGRFGVAGDFDAYFHPAPVTVALLTDTVHHLEVFGKVKVVEHDGCVYGGYTLRTDKDRFGTPLTIWQRTYLTRTFYFPFALRNAAESRRVDEKDGETAERDEALHLTSFDSRIKYTKDI